MSKRTQKGDITKRELIRKVRRFCLWCCGGHRKYADDCMCYECEWWPHRFGNLKPQEQPKYHDSQSDTKISQTDFNPE